MEREPRIDAMVAFTGVGMHFFWGVFVIAWATYITVECVLLGEVDFERRNRLIRVELSTLCYHPNRLYPTKLFETV